MKQKDALRRSSHRFLILTGCIKESCWHSVPVTVCLTSSTMAVLPTQSLACTRHPICSVTGTMSIGRYSNLYNLIISCHMQQCCLIKTIGSADTSKTTQTSFSIFSRQFSCCLQSVCGLIFSKAPRAHVNTPNPLHIYTHRERDFIWFLEMHFSLLPFFIQASA